MLQHLDIVPFLIDNDSHAGLTETEGILSANERGIVLEFRIVDAILGIAKGRVRTTAIGFADLQSITFRARTLMMGGYIELRARRQGALEELPESRMGMVRLKIKRRDCSAAEAFCMAVREALGRMRNEQLMDDLNRLERGDGEALA